MAGIYAPQQIPVKANATTAVPVNLGADTIPNQPFDALYVGVAGNIKVDMANTGLAVVFSNVPVGMFAVSCTKVYSTANGTTATNLVGLNW